VIVSFLEGDINQPIITGSVYNAEQMPPYGLPDGKVVSGMKSNSTPGGGGYNEISLDDTKDQEKMTVHAQYDRNTTVEHDESTTVVSGNETHSVQSGTQSVTIKGNTSLTVQAGDRTVDVTGNYKLDTTSEVSIQAPTKITLTCGGSSVTMEPGKITILSGGGASLTLDADALAVSSAGSQFLLDANATTASSAGSQVLLDSNATMTGVGEATVEAPKAVLSGGGGGSTVTNDASGIAVAGTKISLN
jgi:type VI secretion system secreted protein VgrG